MNQQALQAKKEAVAEITKGIKESASVTVVSYQGLTVAEIQELRRLLEKDGTSMGVYKNTLVKRAIADTGAPNLDSVLEGPNALVFSKELSAGPKVVAKFSRRHEHLVIRGGMGEGQAFDADQMKALAKLPDRNGLLSMFLSVLNAPIQKFAATVKAASEKDGGAPAPAAE